MEIMADLKKAETESRQVPTPTGETVEDGSTEDGLLNVEVYYTTMYVLEVANKKCSHPLRARRWRMKRSRSLKGRGGSSRPLM
jgi:hypothetical protein